MADATSITQCLQAAQRGDARASAELLPLLYGELHRLAQACMARTPPGNTLQPTALVHEAYLRLVGKADDASWNSRGHFFGAAAQAMRQILVDQARSKASLKRGGGRKRSDLDDVELTFQTPAEDLLALDDALGKLEQVDPRKAKVVLLRYFAGLTNEQTAAALDISVPTVEREWRFSRSFLYSQLSDAPGP
jgi:RNA polymerase sigma factor (TIGR02999 family)